MDYGKLWINYLTDNILTHTISITMNQEGTKSRTKRVLKTLSTDYTVIMTRWVTESFVAAMPLWLVAHVTDSVYTS